MSPGVYLGLQVVSCDPQLNAHTMTKRLGSMCLFTGFGDGGAVLFPHRSGKAGVCVPRPARLVASVFGPGAEVRRDLPGLFAAALDSALGISDRE